MSERRFIEMWDDLCNGKRSYDLDSIIEFGVTDGSSDLYVDDTKFLFRTPERAQAAYQLLKAGQDVTPESVTRWIASKSVGQRTVEALKNITERMEDGEDLPCTVIGANGIKVQTTLSQRKAVEEDLQESWRLLAKWAAPSSSRIVWWDRAHGEFMYVHLQWCSVPAGPKTITIAQQIGESFTHLAQRAIEEADALAKVAPVTSVETPKPRWVPGEQYRTRNDLPARVYATDGGGGYPIQGAIQEANGDWSVHTWTREGRVTIAGENHSRDLMPNH